MSEQPVDTAPDFTSFNGRVAQLHAVTGQNYAAIAGALEVSRTMLHYYRTGVHPPDAGTLLRLTRAEERAGIKPPLSRVRPMSAGNVQPDTESDRQVRWLRSLRDQQRETVDVAERHLREIEGWLDEAEGRVPPNDNRFPRRPEPVAPVRILRDLDTVSLPIFGYLPAGVPQPREGVAARRPVRSVPVERGRFPEGVFGLEVRGESMNAATPRPVLDGDIVVLLPPDQREPQHGDIVAALVDGETTLKRLVRKGRSAHLRSESTNPGFKEIHPAHDLSIQGVLVGIL